MDIEKQRSREEIKESKFAKEIQRIILGRASRIIRRGNAYEQERIADNGEI